MGSLRAPIFEDKVVDYILEMAAVSEREVSVEELFRDPDEEVEKPKAKSSKSAARGKTAASGGKKPAAKAAPKKPKPKAAAKKKES